jgi:hypothetical protein
MSLSEKRCSEIDEDLLNEIAGFIGVLLGACLNDNLDVDVQDMYRVLKILQEKYWRLLIEIGYVEKGEDFRGMYYRDEIAGPIESDKGKSKIEKEVA